MEDNVANSVEDVNKEWRKNIDYQTNNLRAQGTSRTNKGKKRGNTMGRGRSRYVAVAFIKRDNMKRSAVNCNIKM